jgi:hypothetical protein
MQNAVQLVAAQQQQSTAKGAQNFPGIDFTSPRYDDDDALKN